MNEKIFEGARTAVDADTPYAGTNLALNSAMSVPWAILPENLEILLQVAGRARTASPQMLEAYRSSSSHRGERLRIRNKVGILDVTGPLFKKANLFTAISGATSYEMLRRDLQIALDDKELVGILLNVDSPGGEANGCDELAAAVFEGRSRKPITAYVSGMACSGGYWIASAASRIVVSDLAVLGSIGVVMDIADRSKADERKGIMRHEFVSSQSPGKRRDLGTDIGKARIQKMVDDLATVFVAAVAKHRGTSREIVEKNFGAGGVEVGAKAVALGMADDIGQFEAVLESLSAGKPQTRKSVNSGTVASQNAPTMTFLTQPSLGAQKPLNIMEITMEEEKQRIKAIMSSAYMATFPTLANHLAFDTTMSADEALASMAAAMSDLKARQRGEAAGSRSYSRGISGSEADAGWEDAVSRTNARLGNAGESGGSSDWDDAVSEANRRMN